MSLGAKVLDPSKYGEHLAREETAKTREYMRDEAQHQFRDYYETDAEEQEFFEFMDNMPARDKIRFMEVFEDFTVDMRDMKEYVMIPKREQNPELSLFSNLYLDMVDFKDRVRPLAKDMAMWDASKPFQKHSASKIIDDLNEYTNQLSEGDSVAAEEIVEDEAAPEIEASEPSDESSGESSESSTSSEDKEGK